MTNQQIKAYSYLRFSTPEQMRGDSFRRQTALAERYAATNHLDLDTELRFNDAGVSAFRGLNLGPDGQLGHFVVALEQGVVPQGSYLLVESLDRISRESPRVALRALERVVDAGAVVVTLIDGRKYDKETLDTDHTALLTSIIIFMRSHEESAVKASRLKAAWAEKRSKAVTRRAPMTRSCPAWLELDAVAGEYREIPERVEVVQRIFQMTLAGAGQHSIAQALNREGVAPFKQGLHWHRSYVAKLLDSPAVEGTFIPHLQTYEAGKKVRQALEPIKDYFPRIIAAEVIENLRLLRATSSQPRRGRHAAQPLNNIFGGLCRCANCGASITMTNKGGGWLYYVCSRAKAGAGCAYRTLRYKAIEQCFFEEWKNILGAMPQPSRSNKAGVIESIETLQEHLDWIAASTANIIQAIQSSGTVETPASLMERLVELELERVRTAKMLQDQVLRLQTLENNTLERRLANLRDALESAEMDKARVNAALRQVLTAVHISLEDETFVFEWQHNPFRTAIRYTNSPGNRLVIDRIRVPPLPTVPVLPSFAELVMLQVRKASGALQSQSANVKVRGA